MIYSLSSQIQEPVSPLLLEWKVGREKWNIIFLVRLDKSFSDGAKFMTIFFLLLKKKCSSIRNKVLRIRCCLSQSPTSILSEFLLYNIFNEPLFFRVLLFCRHKNPLIFQQNYLRVFEHFISSSDWKFIADCKSEVCLIGIFKF